MKKFVSLPFVQTALIILLASNCVVDQGPPPAPEFEIELSFEGGRGPRLGKGETAILIVNVREGGVPVAGETVTFHTSDENQIQFGEKQVVTDLNGIAKTKAEGISEEQGTVVIWVEARGKEARSPVRVPDISLLGFALLALFFVLASRFQKNGAALRRRKSAPS